MKLAHWNPLRELKGVSERLNRFLSHSEVPQTETHQMDGKEMMTIPDWYPPVDPSERTSNGKETMIVADWTPSVDISETEGEYKIKVEIPDVKKEDVKITLEDGVLTIQGPYGPPSGPGGAVVDRGRSRLQHCIRRRRAVRVHEVRLITRLVPQL